jgi:hypothetical protein
MRKRQPDVVQTVKHAMLAVRIDVEGIAFARRRCYSLLLQIDRQPVTRIGFCFTEQLDDRRNNRLDTELQQRPRRVFA